MITKPKGTYDLYGLDASKFIFLEEEIHKLMKKYNYKFIRTPVFEEASLFHRAVGENTDIVSKETYDFTDRAGRNLSLRPEGTAGVVRSYIENKMAFTGNNPQKLFYIAPMYRYERPQKGRYREFTQFGVEALGSSSPYIDAELIIMGVELLKILGIEDYKVKLNSLGNEASRLKYREDLVNYLKPHINDLCEDCKSRFETNPLRILDCKVDAGSAILKEAPKVKDSLDEESKAFFDEVKKILDVNLINYEIDDNLVRGLDYYSHTVFEISSVIDDRELAIIGGGRYDALCAKLGGPDTPAAGFAMGIERALSLMTSEIDDSLDVFVIGVSELEKMEALKIIRELRNHGFSADMSYLDKGLKAQFKEADRNKAKFICILNEEDLKNDEVMLKNNRTREEERVFLEYLTNYLEEKLNLEEMYYEKN